MATPIAQSAVDEERDRLIAEHAEETVAAITTCFENSSGLMLNLSNENDYNTFSSINGESNLFCSKNRFLSNSQVNNISGLTSLKSISGILIYVVKI